MIYINRREGRAVETVDSCPDRKEARRLVGEYQMGDRSAVYYTSSRADRETREAEARAERLALASGPPPSCPRELARMASALARYEGRA